MVTLYQPTEILCSDTIKQHIDKAIALVEKDVLRVDRTVSLSIFLPARPNTDAT